MHDHTTLSDAELFNLCREYGANALSWKRKFLGLLPEVERRGLYEKKGFSSVFEFAHKLAGISQRQVAEALNLDDRLRLTPILHEMFVKGEVSPNKLYRVASIATPENQKELADKVRLLPSRTLETLVKDQKPKNEQKIPHVRMIGLHIDEDVKAELAEMQAKGIDINRELREFLERRKREIEVEKEKVAEEQRLITREPLKNNASASAWRF